MLSDRSYMRDDYPRERTSVLTWLICALGAGFIVQLVFGASWTAQSARVNELALTIDGLKTWKLWTLFTHSFLHDTHIVPHIVANLLALYFLGRELLPILGSRRFLGLFFGAILLGGLTWTAFHWRTGGIYYGATAGVAALLMVFACFYPHQRMDLLFLFVFPISFRPKHLAFALAIFDLFGLIIFEVAGLKLPFKLPSGFTIAHSAHVGGMLAGWIYFRYFHDVRWQLPAPPADVGLPRWNKRPAKIPAAESISPNPSSPADLRAEVDRILDKINSEGFAALTAEEKRVLDEAKDLPSRR